jgi:hypothetical protein
LTVSTNTPAGNAGEYIDTQLANGGSGSGGTGTWRPGDFEVVLVVLVFVEEDLDAGCLVPFVGLEGSGCGAVDLGGRNVYGGLGMFSGLIVWICNAITSSNLFSLSHQKKGSI